MEREDLVPDRIYFVEANDCYAVTPDCVGVYWYDTWEEVIDAHGPAGIHTISHIED